MKLILNIIFAAGLACIIGTPDAAGLLSPKYLASVGQPGVTDIFNLKQL
jgi:hypothetical protein